MASKTLTMCYPRVKKSLTVALLLFGMHKLSQYSSEPSVAEVVFSSLYARDTWVFVLRMFGFISSRRLLATNQEFGVDVKQSLIWW